MPQYRESGFVGVDTRQGEVVLNFPGTGNPVGLAPSEALRMARCLIQAVEKLANERAIETHSGEKTNETWTGKRDQTPP